MNGPDDITTTTAPETVTGVHLMQGVGVKPAKGFWADAWDYVLTRPAAIVSLVWIGVMVFFAIFAPLIANGHPIYMKVFDHRTAADAAQSFRLKFFPGQPSPESQVREVLDAELRRQSPRVSADRFLTQPPATTAPVTGATGPNAPTEPAYTPDQIDAIAKRLADSKTLDETGGVAYTSWPLLDTLSSADILLLVGGVLGGIWLLAPLKTGRGDRALMLLYGGIQSGVIVIACGIIAGWVTGRDVAQWVRDLEQSPRFVPLAAAAVAAAGSLPFLLVPSVRRFGRRVAWVAFVGAVAGVIAWISWRTPLERWDYRQRQARGEISAVFTLVPFSPNQASTELFHDPPGSGLYTPVIDRVRKDFGKALGVKSPTDDQLKTLKLNDDLLADTRTALRDAAEILPRAPDEVAEKLDAAVKRGDFSTALGVVRFLEAQPSPHFWLGTDGLGQGVLTQILHACRLSISIGLVSTSIAVAIGVTLGALMGYFGGWLDLVLYRVVEIFMAIPVLFLLIVAAGVLPRNIYVMMAIIGAFTWHGAARFVRAEFLKLRGQDFVQSARAAGLPLRSILFRHMLPNGVTPVLVDASFAIALAILFEAILSFLGLGPEGQASWGKLLSSAYSEEGVFKWWLAIYPGFAIFLTVLAYNLVGEALRDAIDPKLKKARV